VHECTSVYMYAEGARTVYVSRNVNVTSYEEEASERARCVWGAARTGIKEQAKEGGLFLI
jgi:hypothetical protein